MHIIGFWSCETPETYAVVQPWRVHMVQNRFFSYISPIRPLSKSVVKVKKISTCSS
jgi:hypothetical protein